jgi:putative membrane-bound dehydrogenase-like protein
MLCRAGILLLFAAGLLAGVGPLMGLSEFQKPGFSNGKPLTPREEQATFRVPEGFKVELAACEPQIVDPVALAFDEKGRLFVAEMHGYPNEGVATGKIATGRVVMLEDRDGDGFYERSTVFADHLRFPTAVMPYRGGLLVANAPDLIYLEDTDGDGKADKSRVLYTGFDLSNIQQLPSALQWGLDNWVHACAGGSGGTIHSGDKPEQPPVVLRGRGFRFHPDQPGNLEPTSGGGQFGLAQTEWGQWLTATNSQHLRHIVLPDRYLRRNPLLPVRAVTLDIPDHGAACKVHRISPFEAWRVERTQRRKGGPDAKRFPTTELVPGGFITSACSPLAYHGGQFAAEFNGQLLVCDPANNLIHRDLLEPKGATFVAKRVDEGCEFFASTDNFCRPVNLAIGPDGAIYVADFYREVIETPLSLPPDIKKNVNLQTRKRGRIWRIVPETGHKIVRPRLDKATPAELVRGLANPNQWWRLTCQRLLIERQDRAAVQPLRQLLQNGKYPLARLHALWTLQGLNGLRDSDVERGLRDPVAGVREHALILAEDRLATSAPLRQLALTLADDSAPRVRFQLAFTLGAVPGPQAAAALGKIVRRDLGDPWVQVAVLSSAHGRMAPALLEALVQGPESSKASPALLQLVTQLAALTAAAPEQDNLVVALGLLEKGVRIRSARAQMALLEGIGQGLQRRQFSLAKFWDKPPAQLKKSVAAALPLFAAAGQTALAGQGPLEDRLSAVRLLRYGPFAATSQDLQKLLSPQLPPQVQLEAVRALAEHNHPRVGALLLERWLGYSPEVRREVVAALFARTDRLQLLLTALEKKQVLPTQLEPTRLALLKKHADPQIRRQANKFLARLVVPARQKVVEKYQPALELKRNAARGQIVFRKNCATCHRLENVGFETGPDLLSVLPGKSADELLIAIIDPNREVDPRYLDYMVTTTAGKTVTGRIMTETASSITLRRGENAEDVILRSEIESIQSTGRSLMPDGLEAQVSMQEMADLIGYLQAVVRKK